MPTSNEIVQDSGRHRLSTRASDAFRALARGIRLPVRRLSAGLRRSPAGRVLRAALRPGVRAEVGSFIPPPLFGEEDWREL